MSYKTIELRHSDVCHALMLLGDLSPDVNDKRGIMAKVAERLKARVESGAIEQVARGRYRMRVRRQEKR
jgi:hypothetical protein